MELLKVVFIPKAQIQFTEQEIDALFQASAAHYDSKCRQAGQVGGVLWGMRNQIDDGKADCDLSWDDVNLLAKIAEQLELTHRNDPALCARLNYGQQSFHAILIKLSEEYERVNK